MQPYFCPYIGYFQLMNSVDKFILYDNVEYTKKGWINRNRILVNGKDEYISIPLEKASDYLKINERYLAKNWKNEREKILNKIKNNYLKSPFFNNVFPIIKDFIMCDDENLFNFILYSIEAITTYLEIKTKIIISSSIDIDHQLKSENKVIALCKSQNASTYINAIGGVNLYNKENFSNENINLQFIKSNEIIYQQFENNFVPWLSIIDVMMFNSKNQIKNHLENSFVLI